MIAGPLNCQIGRDAVDVQAVKCHLHTGGFHQPVIVKVQLATRTFRSSVEPKLCGSRHILALPTSGPNVRHGSRCYRRQRLRSPDAGARNDTTRRPGRSQTTRKLIFPVGTI